MPIGVNTPGWGYNLWLPVAWPVFGIQDKQGDVAMSDKLVPGVMQLMDGVRDRKSVV